MTYRRALISVFALALVAAACTGSDGGSGTTTPAIDTPEATTAATTPLGTPQGTPPPTVGGTTFTGPVAFSDVTELAGLSFTYATPFSLENYTSKMDTAKMRGGAAVGDFNNDGWQDLFVLGGGLEPPADRGRREPKRRE